MEEQDLIIEDIDISSESVSCGPGDCGPVNWCSPDDDD